VSVIPPIGPRPTHLGAWRLDQKRFASTWDSGEGARQYGGRWSSAGRRVVYCSVDPATAILEVAVHQGFRTLDIEPHVLTSAVIIDAARAHVVMPADVPNANWLRPCYPSAGQQRFGDVLLAAHPFVLIPSAVATHSWNILFDPAVATGLYTPGIQEDFALDTRLHPARP